MVRATKIPDFQQIVLGATSREDDKQRAGVVLRSKRKSAEPFGPVFP